MARITLDYLDKYILGQGNGPALRGFLWAALHSGDRALWGVLMARNKTKAEKAAQGENSWLMADG